MENPYGGVYGLTGVMGSGKSTAARQLAAAGATVIDADQIARDVIAPDSSQYLQLRKKLEAAFGAYVTEPLFDAAGFLKRALLGKITFGDPQRVAKMGSIMHPAIQREFARRVAMAPTGQPVVYDVPLLFEGELHKLVRATIVVYAPETTCIARAVARAAEKGEAMTEQDARARLARQISIEKKREMADYILDNSGKPSDLTPQVDRLYQRLEPI
jgi:dephospho-CoA kinase